MSNALDNDVPNKTIQKAKQAKKTRKKWLIGMVIGLIAIVGVMAAYSESIDKAQKLAASKNIQSKQSEVKTSSATLTAKDIEDRKPNTSPTILSVDENQRKEKKQAAIDGVSHIDNTDILSAKEEVKVDMSSATQKEEPKVVVVEPKKAPATPRKAKEEKTPPPPTREQIIRGNLRKLFKTDMETYYPKRIVDTTQHIANFEANYGALASTRDSFIDGMPMVADNPHTTTMKEDRIAAEQKAALEAEQKANSNYAASASNGTTEAGKTGNPENNPDMVRMLDMGDVAAGTIKDAINSDHKLDVFINLHDHPLKGVRLRANFELTEAQDGILLKINQMQYKDYIQAVEGYAVDITIDNSPLFDNDVDTHFVRRFLARASAAAIVPWIDFIQATTTTISGDNIIVDNPVVSSTKDRMIGSIASVAKEFIPELRKNANIPATVSVPKNWPVGVVFVNPLYLPKGLFDDDETTNPDRSYDQVFSSSTH